MYGGLGGFSIDEFSGDVSPSAQSSYSQIHGAELVTSTEVFPGGRMRYHFRCPRTSRFSDHSLFRFRAQYQKGHLNSCDGCLVSDSTDEYKIVIKDKDPLRTRLTDFPDLPPFKSTSSSIDGALYALRFRDKHIQISRRR